jgi:hypothetical protein
MSLVIVSTALYRRIERQGTGKNGKRGFNVKREKWWRCRDLNPGHRDYDSPALPLSYTATFGPSAGW